MAAASFALCFAARQPLRARSVAKPCETPAAAPADFLHRRLDREAHGADRLVDGLDRVDGAVGRLVELVELVVHAVDRAAGLVITGSSSRSVPAMSDDESVERAAETEADPADAERRTATRKIVSATYATSLRSVREEHRGDLSRPRPTG